MLEDHSQPTRTSQTEGGTDKLNVAKIRQAFYKGIAQACLKEAWRKLGEFRDNKKICRTYRHIFQLKEGVPCQFIDNLIGRGEGVVARWFRVETEEWSKSWDNLIMVMTVLDAGWNDLVPLPSKEERRQEGVRQALVYVRKNGGEEKAKIPQLSVEDLRILQELIDDEQWWLERRLSKKRETSLDRIAKKTDVSKEDLDEVDQQWGEAWIQVFQAYLCQIDPNVWQEIT